MGRYGNYPKTVEDCLTISINKLKEWDYLNFIGTKSGTISWSRNGQVYSNIRISVTRNNFETFIILDYKADGEPITYKVKIVAKQSNLGKGEVLYFVCPHTNKFCRKLYLHSGYFFHREAFTGLMYEKQLESKKWRNLTAIFDNAFLKDEVYEERYKKYFKTHYKGKPTKRYLKLDNKIRTAESYPADTMQRLLMSK